VLVPDGAGSGAGPDALAVGEEDVVRVVVGVVVCAGVLELVPLDCTEASSVEAVVVEACWTGCVRVA
jgi:hypothetical protein